jgi:hypothetical protein
MKKLVSLLFLFFACLVSFAGTRDSVIYYSLPDTVRAISFMADLTVTNRPRTKFCVAGIKTDAVTLSLQKFPIGASIRFQANNSRQLPVAKGFNVRDPDLKFNDLGFSYDWKIGETYRFLIAQATDSAENFSLYSGYVFLPKENKWKLIGTLKVEGRWNSIQIPAVFYGGRKKLNKNMSVTTGQVWCQRQNGSWKNMLRNTFTPPLVNLYSHVDSLEQLDIEKKQVVGKFFPPNEFPEPSKVIGEAYTKFFKDGIYYYMIKEGTGKQVSVNDTVTVYYKGMLLDGSVFDETKDKPATFPLNRLIRGWQIGVPLCNVGGKIRLVIPSNLAYSIRTRSAKIPPNSILVFEIEVIDTKGPQ